MNYALSAALLSILGKIEEFLDLGIKALKKHLGEEEDEDR